MVYHCITKYSLLTRRELCRLSVSLLLTQIFWQSAILLRSHFICGNRFFFHPCILTKRLCLTLARLYPLLKVFEVNCRHVYSAPVFPTFLIVSKIVALGFVSIVESKHHLMLVKTAIWVVLVHYKHIASVPTINVIREEHVYMVTINTHCTTNVAISVVHLAFPLLTVSISAFTHAALRLLNGDVKRTNFHMSLLVVACLLLRLGGFGVHFG